LARFIEYMRLIGYEDTFIYYYLKSIGTDKTDRELEDLLTVKEDEYA